MIYVAINECDYASTGNIANDVLLELQKHGYTCYFANLKNKNKFDYTFHVYNGKLEYQLGRILNKIDGSDGFHNKGATKKLVKWLRDIKPDIIHLHNLHGHWINLPILFNYMRETKLKILWTFHDCWPLTGRCAHFDFNGCDKWKNECAYCKFKNAYPRSYFLDRTSHFHNLKKDMILSVKDKCTIITPSKWLYELVRQSYLKDFPINIINNGIGIDLFSFEDKTQELLEKYKLRNKKIILCVAHPFNEKKGTYYIEECIKFFSKLEDNKVFVLLGLNKKQIKKFSEYTNCLALEPTYDKSKVISWFRLADIFLNPTLEDNFPTVTIESMACGTPPLTFNSGGATEAIRDFPDFIVDRGDLNSLIEKINLINKTPEISELLKLNFKNFTKNIMIEKYIDVITDNGKK